MNNKSVLLLVGAVLVLIGVFKPNFPIHLLPNINNNVVSVESQVTDAPGDAELYAKAKNIVDILSQSQASNKKNDCLKLSSLYADMAVLIEIDNNEAIIKDTAAIREANILAGKMLNLDIKDKYEGLSEAAKDLLISQLGDDDVSLDQDLRNKASESFRALSWAFYEGSK